MNKIIEFSDNKYQLEFEITKMYMGSIFFVVLCLKEEKKIENSDKINCYNSHSWISINSNSDKDIGYFQDTISS